MTPSIKPLELRSDLLRMVLRADIGGSIAGLWRGDVPVLRSADPLTLSMPRGAASFPLMPYSNRLAYRRFKWLGQTHTTEPNFEDTPHSLHGVAWRRPWTVGPHAEQDAVLSLSHRSDADWPFDFEARQTFTLTPTALELRLEFTNTAATAAPSGLGWHPYFPKRLRSRLHIELTDRWEADATQLPTRKVPQPGIDADVAHLEFDHCFEGWRGPAVIRDEKLSLKLTSSLPYLIVYTPHDKDYFAVEPVSHVSNAINMAEPAAYGLRTLQPGETTSAWMRLEINGV
ncbi:MAG: aldose 1-epimerase [Rhizobacter sp.]|nr:aldose 1-epimerase [Rhizobacter sp.]